MKFANYCDESLSLRFSSSIPKVSLVTKVSSHIAAISHLLACKHKKRQLYDCPEGTSVLFFVVVVLFLSFLKIN